MGTDLLRRVFSKKKKKVCFHLLIIRVSEAPLNAALVVSARIPVPRRFPSGLVAAAFITLFLNIHR